MGTWNGPFQARGALLLRSVLQISFFAAKKGHLCLPVLAAAENEI
jgi:hypothetical protein